jgi:hypothetical protein
MFSYNYKQKFSKDRIKYLLIKKQIIDEYECNKVVDNLIFNIDDDIGQLIKCINKSHALEINKLLRFS